MFYLKIRITLFVGVLLLTFSTIRAQHTLYQNKPVLVAMQRNPDNTIDFSYEKEIIGNVYIHMKFSDLENAYQPTKGVVVSGSKGYLFRLKPIDSEQPIRYTWSNTMWIKGMPIKGVDTTLTYILPFKQNTEVRSWISAPCDTDTSKKCALSVFFYTDSVKTACAVRKGLVIEVKDNNINPRSNQVLIEHKDGSIAKYSGFASGKINVKTGESILPSEPIGELFFKEQAKEYELRLNVCFLSKDKVRDYSQGFKDQKRFYYGINPMFLTSDGIIHAKRKGKYTTIVSDEVLFSEMKKSEIKRWKQNNN